MKSAVMTAIVGVLLVAGAAAGQEPLAAGGAETTGAALRVFLDCHRGCDDDYIRTEIDFVDHVRDREAADVHILVTTLDTGGGGTEYTISFIGREAFEDIQETTTYTTRQTDTRDDVRRGLVRALKVGLVRYVAETPLRDSLEVDYRPPRQQDPNPVQAAGDPWRFWVFRVRSNVNTSGEESSRSVSLSGSFSASRVTERWKSSASVNLNYRRNVYDLDDEEGTYVSISRDSSISGILVKSLGPHWGGGLRMSVSSSTYTNQRRTLRVSPAVEYNVFPYAETTRRQLTFRYSAGAHDFTYRAPTIYQKTRETLMRQALAANLDMRQPWGTLDLQVEASQYVPDLKKNRISFDGGIDIRLFRGLSLNVSGDTSFIRDQIYLPAGQATPEEILLRQRQIATSYDYSLRMGFAYTFGSVYNNVVNSRLSGF